MQIEILSRRHFEFHATQNLIVQFGDIRIRELKGKDGDSRDLRRFAESREPGRGLRVGLSQEILEKGESIITLPEY